MHKKIIIEDRDLDLLRFLWDFKVATTAALSTKFFGCPNRAAGYRRLLKLSKYGFIQSICDKRAADFVWCLDRSGFQLVRESLPPLKEEGYMSEHVSHDLLASAFQLGNCFMEKPAWLTFVTEQELRRVDFEFYPELIPRTDLHRPDGYWLVESGREKKLVAFEAELNDQRLNRYEEVFNFYDRYKDIFSVLWLVPTVKKAKNMHEYFRSLAHSNIDYHNFAVVTDFRKHCWDAKIIYGPEVGKTIRAAIDQRLCESPSAPNSLCMLETRKYPIKSVLNGVKNFSDFPV